MKLTDQQISGMTRQQLIDLVRAQEQIEERIIAWLENPQAMRKYDLLSECIYDEAVFPRTLAEALRAGEHRK